jgi:hypothetical protein
MVDGWAFMVARGVWMGQPFIDEPTPPGNPQQAANRPPIDSNIFLNQLIGCVERPSSPVSSFARTFVIQRLHVCHSERSEESRYPACEVLNVGEG